MFELRILREYFIYQLQILTIYDTHRRLFMVKISGDYLYLFSRNKIFLKESASLSPTITGVKVNQWS